jgi:hypothetical protein
LWIGWWLLVGRLSLIKGNGKIEEFGDKEKFPKIHIDSGDVAIYIAKEVCSGVAVGKVVIDYQQEKDRFQNVVLLFLN